MGSLDRGTCHVCMACVICAACDPKLHRRCDPHMWGNSTRSIFISACGLKATRLAESVICVMQSGGEWAQGQRAPEPSIHADRPGICHDYQCDRYEQ